MGTRLIELLARALLAVYPRRVREELHDAFLDAAAHRLGKERTRSSVSSALARTATILIADTLREAPRAWRVERGHGGVRFIRDDLRLACRKLVHTPGFTAVAVLTLGLTIGANAAILAIADAVLFRPLPYRDVGRLQVVQMLDRSSGARYFAVRHAYLEAIGDAGSSIGEVATLEETMPLHVTTPAGVESLETAAVTANYFDVLGVGAWRGRLFTRSDAAGPGRIAVLTHESWLQRFGGDEGVVGRTLTLGDLSLEIVGVLSPDFLFSSPYIGDPEVVTVSEPVASGASGVAFNPVLRLAPGVSRSQAQAALDAVAAAVPQEGEVDEGTSPALFDVRGALYSVGGPILELLLTAAGLVLLLGCANLANLFAVRSRRRTQETGVRAALGASRARIVRPIVLEALVVAVLGAAFAVGVTRLLFEAMLSQVPPVAYGAADVGVDVRVALLTLALGLAAGFAFSIVPAWRSARIDAPGLIRAGGSMGSGGRAVLGPGAVAVQVAAAVVLVFGATLTGRTFVEIVRSPQGFHPEGVAVVSVHATDEGSLGEPQDLYRDALEAIARRGEVTAAGAASSVPLVRPIPFAAIRAEEGGPILAGVVHTLPGYFDAAGIRLVSGRDLAWDDVDADAPVAVLSAAAAERLVPGSEPVGRTFTDHRGRRVTVVGVADDATQALLPDFPPPAYLIGGAETRSLLLVARVRASGPGTLEALRSEVAALSPTLMVDARWWDDAIDALTQFRNPRFQAMVLTSFALLALVLTAVGVYGVVAYLVASRMRELGIRMALGSTRSGVTGLVVRQSLWPVLGGIALGLLATRLLAGLAQAQLYQVDTHDPLTLAAAVATVLLSALIAASLPARRVADVARVIAERS